uniref:FK506-binding protein 4 isoform X2 n=1 Tax=Scatophagus argus TaxID=75038 RepID=UPI001ED82914|nr:FK506-binding protein 4 isoform X2 [Scatophagus argus]
MKAQIFLPVTVIVSVALMGVVKIRSKEQEKDDKQRLFVNIKMRVTNDVLEEYENERTETSNQLVKARGRYKIMEEELKSVQIQADKAKAEVDTCKGNQKIASDKLASLQTELKNLQAAMDEETTKWKTEAEALKKQVSARSSVCDFLKTGSDAGSKLCNGQVIAVAPKQEEPKAEAPKQEEPKAEVPKQEEPKAEAPKQEEPKAEAPKKR